MMVVYGGTGMMERLNTKTEQLSFAPNGNLSPCPYRLECRTYGIGCQGGSYWCKNGEGMRKDDARQLRVRGTTEHL